MLSSPGASATWLGASELGASGKHRAVTAVSERSGKPGKILGEMGKASDSESREVRHNSVRNMHNQLNKRKIT